MKTYKIYKVGERVPSDIVRIEPESNINKLEFAIDVEVEYEDDNVTLYPLNNEDQQKHIMIIETIDPDIHMKIIGAPTKFSPQTRKNIIQNYLTLKTSYYETTYPKV